MTRCRRILDRFVLPAGATLLLALVAGGCGKSEPRSSASAPAGEIRGEPIRGEPIAARPTPSVAGAAAVASSNPAPAVAANPAAAPSAPGAVGAAPNVDVKAGNSSAASTPVPASTASAATASAAPVAPVAAAGTTSTVDAPLTVGFDRLGSFQYTLPDGPVDTNTVSKTQASSQIPDTIKGLNNRFVSLKGFMLPLKVEKGLVTELLVMRDQSMCCYGTVPRINEWVSVKMVGAGVKPIMDQAVTFVGKLKVGEMYENGYLVGIYALDGERMTGPLDL